MAITKVRGQNPSLTFLCASMFAICPSIPLIMLVHRPRSYGFFCCGNTNFVQGKIVLLKNSFLPNTGHRSPHLPPAGPEVGPCRHIYHPPQVCRTWPFRGRDSTQDTRLQKNSRYNFLFDLGPKVLFKGKLAQVSKTSICQPNWNGGGDLKGGEDPPKGRGPSGEMNLKIFHPGTKNPIQKIHQAAL